MSMVVQAKPEDFIGAKPDIAELSQHEGLMEGHDLVIICLKDTIYRRTVASLLTVIYEEIKAKHDV